MNQGDILTKAVNEEIASKSLRLGAIIARSTIVALRLNLANNDGIGVAFEFGLLIRWSIRHFWNGPSDVYRRGRNDVGLRRRRIVRRRDQVRKTASSADGLYVKFKSTAGRWAGSRLSRRGCGSRSHSVVVVRNGWAAT